MERHSLGERCRSRKTLPDPEAEEKKTRLIQEATDNITILQDAVNFEMATDEEISMLSSWKNTGY